ncbi:ATP synthase F1 subunit epsilon [Phycisphaeraceae bacterium D3-23]
MANTFTCTLTTPESEVFSREVSYVDLPAHDGQVGILDNHAPLLVKLGYGALRLKDSAGQETAMFVGGGFAQVKGGTVEVLTDEARGLDELTKAEAEQAMADATALSTTSPSEAARKARARRPGRTRCSG